MWAVWRAEIIMNITQINSPAPTGFDLLAELRALLARADAAAKGIDVTSRTLDTIEAAVEPQKPKAATKETRNWMLSKLAAYGDADLIRYAQARAILLPVEKLTDWPLHKVPTSRQAMDEMILDVKKWQDEIPMTFGSVPKPSEPEQDRPLPGALRVAGNLAHATFKEGEKNGRKWVRYSLKVGEDWYSTFDKKIWQTAESLMQQQVEITYEHTGEFKTIKTIAGIAEVTP
jgi:hypothetical protein